MMKFFENHPVIAFMGNRSMDFTPIDFDAPLSPAQREYLKQQIGVDTPRVFWRRQVHGDGILMAKGSPDSCQGCPDADAYITYQTNLPLAIRTADCVPVFLYDPVRKVIGLVHAGWKGTVKEITFKTVMKMKQDAGSEPQNILAVLGPCIQACCYEVGGEFRRHFPEDIAERAGKLYVDVAKNNVRQLQKAGLMKENINNTGICTYCDSQYFSFRREAQEAGRMISLMMIPA